MCRHEKKKNEKRELKYTLCGVAAATAVADIAFFSYLKIKSTINHIWIILSAGN